MFVQGFFIVVLFLEIFSEPTFYFRRRIYLMASHLWQIDSVAIETRARFISD